ncbi:MAG: phosphoribosylformylglycinamidine synthase subunit PurS [Thermoplasmata archaeon]|jgi:phosphoribosylformylglycinamidine synthase|nr:phosphoribosylformylglycinamidine synthase subunit PurS [Thermoplasmatales archaeon]PMP75172.1 MAG: phosphoribosylformylglycinamidine synthase PurS protein [Aciduliprofundum sp.]PMP75312.1 MAG: phosphoribosylformylglycinamidine synthase PurS protein [Aciduliprofundum sp.]HEU12517.1 phosphoribosylformylglycinamidine synthase subunit PurS [Euryarchaeota archaeon]
MIKLRITIGYKEGVEDPEGLAVKNSLRLLDFKNVGSVKVSKVYEIYIEDTEDPMREAEEMCDRLLVNPVIHDYRIEMERL